MQGLEGYKDKFFKVSHLVRNSFEVGGDWDSVEIENGGISEF